jgi:hypothetical protein
LNLMKARRRLKFRGCPGGVADFVLSVIKLSAPFLWLPYMAPFGINPPCIASLLIQTIFFIGTKTLRIQ